MKTKLISTILAGTMATGLVFSGTVAKSFNQGRASAAAIETSIKDFSSLANKYVEKAKELEKLASDQNTDINTLLEIVDSLKELKSQLTTDKDNLLENLNSSNSDNADLKEEVERLESELIKANLEIENANYTLEQLELTADSYLNEQMFEELTIPEEIDISNALMDDASDVIETPVTE